MSVNCLIIGNISKINVILKYKFLLSYTSATIKQRVGVPD